MLTTTLLGLAAVAAAAPVSQSPFPAYTTSKAFRLILNVTDPSKDFTPSINSQQIFSYLQAAGPARAGPAEANGNKFYQYHDPSLGSKYPEFGGQLLTEALRGPDTVLGFQQANSTDYTRDKIYIDEGAGSPGVQISVGGDFPHVRPNELSGGYMTFAVCNVTVPRLFHAGTAWFLNLEWIHPSTRDGQFGLFVPEGCAPVRLLPECDTLHEVPEGSKAAPFHKAAREVRCYEDVKAIDWSKYVFAQ